MKTIDIDETVLSITPQEFKNLPDVRYRLTKTESFREGWVNTGSTQSGDLSIVSVQGCPAARILGNGVSGYIRTSPIVKVVDQTDTSLTFHTEGGVYLLERV